MTEPISSTDLASALRQAVSDVFALESVTLDAGQAGVVDLHGRFLVDSDEAYEVISGRFQTLGYLPLFREEGGRQVIRAMPGKLPAPKANLRLPGILFAATVASTLFAGIFYSWQPEEAPWQNVLNGVLFALSLLVILIAHEMGHYLVSRRLGVPVTLPHFIPLPVSFLGTMGAVIQMKAPPRNRRHLLAVGVAGPLAGLALALPLLALGLGLSEVKPLSQVCREHWQQYPSEPGGYSMEGNSILYATLKIAVFGRFLPDCDPGTAQPLGEIVHTVLNACPPCEGEDVFLHPIALAAWAGLLVTGLNLIPAGTLDGGHVAYALLGKGTRYLTAAVIGVLVVLGLWGLTQRGDAFIWLLWAGLIFLARRSATPLDDVTRLRPWQVGLAIVLIVIFVLTFSPIPMTIISFPPAGAP